MSVSGVQPEVAALAAANLSEVTEFPPHPAAVVEFLQRLKLRRVEQARRDAHDLKVVPPYDCQVVPWCARPERGSWGGVAVIE